MQNKEEKQHAMNLLVRKLTESQWIMLVTVAAIGLFMMVASSAQAFYAGRDYGGTTLVHCGLLPTQNIIYTQRPLNTRIIQTKLEDQGFSVGPAGIDGVYGRHTRSAVTQFQKYNNLAADGVVGAKTAQMIAFTSHPSGHVRRCRRPVGITH